MAVLFKRLKLNWRGLLKEFIQSAVFLAYFSAALLLISTACWAGENKIGSVHFSVCPDSKNVVVEDADVISSGAMLPSIPNPNRPRFC